MSDVREEVRAWAPRQEAYILAWNLWGNDDSDYRVLRNAMVATRRKHQCPICFEPIPPGSRVRASTEVFDGKCSTFHVCPLCCEAILRDQAEGDCLHMETRTQMGMERCALERQR